MLAKDVDRRGVAVIIGFVVIIECQLKMLIGVVWLSVIVGFMVIIECWLKMLTGEVWL